MFRALPFLLLSGMVIAFVSGNQPPTNANQQTSMSRPLDNKPIVGITEEIKLKFWSRVKKEEGEACWEWQMKTGKRGYGTFCVYLNRYFAHRVSWLIAHNQDPKGWHVCHHCDNPKCVRPDHLFLGTDKDNLQDMARKGRQIFQKHPERCARGDRHPSKLRPGYLPTGDAHYSRTHPEKLARGDRHSSKLHPELILRGEDSGLAKITESQALEIIELCKTKERQADIGARFGLKQCTVSAIKTGRLWKHIRTTPPTFRPRPHFKQPSDEEQ